MPFTQELQQFLSVLWHLLRVSTRLGYVDFGSEKLHREYSDRALFSLQQPLPRWSAPCFFNEERLLFMLWLLWEAVQSLNLYHCCNTSYSEFCAWQLSLDLLLKQLCFFQKRIVLWRLSLEAKRMANPRRYSGFGIYQWMPKLVRSWLSCLHFDVQEWRPWETSLAFHGKLCSQLHPIPARWRINEGLLRVHSTLCLQRLPLPRLMRSADPQHIAFHPAEEDEPEFLEDLRSPRSWIQRDLPLH